MEWVEFLKKLDKAGWGVLNFNTYRMNGRMYFYLCVSERGGKGQFIKSEGLINELSNSLEHICEEVEKGE